jgi:putative addiction module component (TIGR02574 family)
MSDLLESELRQMSVSEKLLLVEQLWDEIASDVQAHSLPDSQRQELDRRYAEFLQDPYEGSPWSEVRERIIGR